MSEHRATVEWKRSGESRYESYSRAHTLVTLRPKVTFSGREPGAEELRALHHAAHEKCFIANLVKTEVIVEPC